MLQAWGCLRVGLCGFDGFDGVGEGVAEVEEGAAAVGFEFAFVAFDDAGFEGDVLCDEVCDGCWIAAQGGQRGLQRFERECGVGLGDALRDHRVLDDFGTAAGEGAVVERGERENISEYEGGLVEGADHVFLEFVVDEQVDAGFAAHAGVDHAQERGGALDPGDAAAVGGGDEASDVAYEAATEGDDGVVAFELGASDSEEKVVGCVVGFVFFDGGEVSVVNVELRGFERSDGELRPVRAGVVGDDEDAAGVGQCFAHVGAEGLQQT